MRFQPQDLDEIDFSQNLAWAKFANLHPKLVRPRPLLHRYQRAMKYVAASKTGEPLRFTITTGVIKHYRDRADGQWKVSQGDGKEIASGSLPQDGSAHPIEVKVPAAGVYWIEFNDRSAGWGIEAPDEVPTSLALERGRRIIHMGQFRDPLFFFVPRDTKQFQFFWDGGKLEYTAPTEPC